MKRFAIIAAAVPILILGTAIALHYGQKVHNEPAFDMDTLFPTDIAYPAGQIFATTIAEVMRIELDGFFGWRPNDFFLWGPRLLADNNANRQIGIINAIRETMRVFKDNLTKVSGADFDPNLLEADTYFRNDAAKFWFPSAEKKFHEARDSLELYIDGLKDPSIGSRPINKRNAELIKLFQAWIELLSDAHAILFRKTGEDGNPVRCWDTDDDFYKAQGYTHAIYYFMLALNREYDAEIHGRAVLHRLFDEVTTALSEASKLKPLIILDGGPSGLLANHRRNLDGYINEARSKIFSIQEELEK